MNVQERLKYKLQKTNMLYWKQNTVKIINTNLNRYHTKVSSRPIRRAKGLLKQKMIVEKQESTRFHASYALVKRELELVSARGMHLKDITELKQGKTFKYCD